ncbi:MAG: hypothetical protein AAFW46_16155 [Pseudomonadota bacterium]
MRAARSVLAIALGLLALGATPAAAQNLAQQWKARLAGSRLTAYQGSVVSNNSALTVIRFCRNGRYDYYREGSWSAPGVAGGANQGRISGVWDVRTQGPSAFLVYRTDQGQQGYFPMYLQNNGRVNIGGLAYAVEQGAAGC